MNAVASPGVERWRQRFALDPVAALDAALTGRMSLGQYDRARPAEALSRMLSVEEIPLADAAMRDWLVGRLGQPVPEDLSPKRYAEALGEAFRAIQLLPLPESRAWCAARPAQMRVWLRGFYLGSSRDPEAALLVALAHRQPDRKLMFLWHDVIRRGRPVEHVHHALLGLRLMPADDQGAEERNLPKALLRGLLDYGETLIRLGDKKGKSWQEEMDFLAAVYPQSEQTWSRRFREILEARDVSRDLHNWLDQRFSVARREQRTALSKGFLAPPSVDDFNTISRRIETNFEAGIPALKAFFDKYRLYASESGDGYDLVIAFGRMGYRILPHDPTWARELAHEAALWAPGNPITWSLLGRALEAEGDWRRAEAVYWNARRRFPHDAYSHTQLGHALLLHGQEDLGEAVFRLATQLFPDNPVTWAELGHSLRVTGRYEQAVEVYREAQRQRDFNRYPVIANALTDILIDLNRLDEAEDALQWAEQVVPDDDRNQRILAQIRQRLNRAQSGQPAPPRKLQKPEETHGGDLNALADIAGIDLSHAPSLGRAGLWRRQGQGGLQRARAELDALHDGSAKLIELGLLHGAEQGWQAAADWFDGCWQHYAGDGALRVHRLRALARAGATVDWSWERSQYPELLPVIVTEEKGRPPRSNLDPADPELSEEQKQELWFAGLAARDDELLRDMAEENFLAARQVA